PHASGEGSPPAGLGTTPGDVPEADVLSSAHEDMRRVRLGPDHAWREDSRSHACTQHQQACKHGFSLHLSRNDPCSTCVLRPYGTTPQRRRKDSLRRAETTKISVCPGNYSASHFEGSATHISCR